MQNIIINSYSLFFIALFLLIGNVLFGVYKVTTSHMGQQITNVYTATGMEISNSKFQEAMGTASLFEDILKVTVDFVVYFLVGYILFSSFFSRMTPLNFVVGFVFSIILGAITNYLYTQIYNSIVYHTGVFSALFTYDLGNFLLQNFGLIVVANVFAGAMAFLYSSASSRFRGGFGQL